MSTSNLSKYLGMKKSGLIAHILERKREEMVVKNVSTAQAGKNLLKYTNGDLIEMLITLDAKVGNRCLRKDRGREHEITLATIQEGIHRELARWVGHRRGVVWVEKAGMLVQCSFVRDPDTGELKGNPAILMIRDDQADAYADAADQAVERFQSSHETGL